MVQERIAHLLRILIIHVSKAVLSVEKERVVVRNARMPFEDGNVFLSADLEQESSILYNLVQWSIPIGDSDSQDIYFVLLSQVQSQNYSDCIIDSCITVNNYFLGLLEGLDICLAFVVGYSNFVKFHFSAAAGFINYKLDDKDSAAPLRYL